MLWQPKLAMDQRSPLDDRQGHSAPTVDDVYLFFWRQAVSDDDSSATADQTSCRQRSIHLLTALRWKIRSRVDKQKHVQDDHVSAHCHASRGSTTGLVQPAHRSTLRPAHSTGRATDDGCT